MAVAGRMGVAGLAGWGSLFGREIGGREGRLAASTGRLIQLRLLTSKIKSVFVECALSPFCVV